MKVSKTVFEIPSGGGGGVKSSVQIRLKSIPYPPSQNQLLPVKKIKKNEGRIEKRSTNPVIGFDKKYIK